MRPATLRFWPLIAAATAVGLYCGLSLHLTGSLAPWADWDGLVGTPPAPALTAVRKALSERASRANAAPADAQDLAAAAAFYEARRGPLLWVTDSGLSERGRSVIGEIRRADDWGLRARDFALPQLPAGAVSPEAAASGEIALTLAVLKYARHARGGRLGDLASISPALDYKPPVRPPGEVLAEIAATSAPDAYLRSLHPQHAQFEALRRLYVKLRGPDLAAGGTAGRDGADKAVLVARILVNMERWRWLPPDLGQFYVWNNVPEFLTRVVRRGEVIHTDHIVAGQQEWPTPAFSADMKTIVFHPSWGVPDGIKRKELLPRLRDSSQSGLVRLFTGAQSGQAVLEELKLQAYYQGRPINADQVDWSTANIGAYEFRQPPGPENPLGTLKFSFPNKHDVYMHDTTASERDLFAKPYRGFSHGCMRVADPHRLAVVLLAEDKGWSEQQVDSVLEGGPREVPLTTRIPVHMTYFTVLVDTQGNPQTFGDLYGIDTRMAAALFGPRVSLVTPRYDDEMKAMRARYVPQASAGGQTLADAIASIFSP